MTLRVMAKADFSAALSRFAMTSVEMTIVVLVEIAIVVLVEARIGRDDNFSIEITAGFFAAFSRFQRANCGCDGEWVLCRAD